MSARGFMNKMGAPQARLAMLQWRDLRNGREAMLQTTAGGCASC
jgi:hypothetical protein